MAGIYLHIPFCAKKCAYCDFFSVANTQNSERFISALLKEMEIRKDFLENEKIQTIYFGGGTPSLLSPPQLEILINGLHKYFSVDNNIEFTLEANPDDLNRNYLTDILSLGVNRLSIGIQSFHDKDLKLMKRRHNVHQAKQSVLTAQETGFKNISIDLMYGLPDLKIHEWEENIKSALDLNIQHISAYHLTIEPNTLFKKWWQQNKITLPDDDESLNQFNLLKELTQKNGFLHYEISNFAKDGFLSLHNTNYWMGKKYLGLGPSAHSYNLSSRQWNISNLQVYLSEISKGILPNEIENLSLNEKYNDYILVSMRTMWGADIQKIENEFGASYKHHFLNKQKKYFEKGLLKKSGNRFILSDKALFISDQIISELFIV